MIESGNKTNNVNPLMKTTSMNSNRSPERRPTQLILTPKPKLTTKIDPRIPRPEIKKIDKKAQMNNT